MFFITDGGSGLKEPLGKVWQFAQDEGVHKHRGRINPQRSMEVEHPVLSFDTKMPDGKLVGNKIRVTLVSPVGSALE